MVGTARKKENSAAVLRFSRCAIPPTMVAIERETPGIMAIHWKKPIASAFFSLIACDSAGWLNSLSTNSMKMPPTTSMVATTHTFSSSSSIRSPQASPMTAAGRKATSSFQ